MESGEVRMCLKVKSTESPDGLNVRCERKNPSQVTGRMELLFEMKKLEEVLDFRGKMGSATLELLTLRHVVLSKGNVEYADRYKSGIQGARLEGNRPFIL